MFTCSDAETQEKMLKVVYYRSSSQSLLFAMAAKGGKIYLNNKDQKLRRNRITKSFSLD